VHAHLNSERDNAVCVFSIIKLVNSKDHTLRAATLPTMEIASDDIHIYIYIYVYTFRVISLIIIVPL